MTLRRVLLGLLMTGLVAATTLAVALPAQAAWTSTSVRWHGAVTQACKVKLDNGNYRVRVRVDNRHGTDRAAAGLNRVKADGQPGSSWTYTRTVAAGTAPVALNFAPGAKVWLIVGSSVGITGEKAVLLRNITSC